VASFTYLMPSLRPTFARRPERVVGMPVLLAIFRLALVMPRKRRHENVRPLMVLSFPYRAETNAHERGPAPTSPTFPTSRAIPVCPPRTPGPRREASPYLRPMGRGGVMATVRHAPLWQLDRDLRGQPQRGPFSPRTFAALRSKPRPLLLALLPHPFGALLVGHRLAHHHATPCESGAPGTHATFG
jgi:hypothetical protein